MTKYADQPLELVEEARNFHEEIGPYLDTLMLAADLVARALAEAAAPDSGPAVTRNVQIALLTSLGNHLHAIGREAPFSYPEPVATLAATVFEVAFTIAHIGGRTERAEAWVRHDDPLRPVWSVADLVKMAAAEQAGGAAGDQATRLYQAYSQLCMVKHASPLLTGVLAFAGDRVIGTGPNPSRASVRVVQFALEQATGLAHTALAAILNSGLVSSPSIALLQGVTDLGSSWSTLRKCSIEEWGREDPLAGKWRQLGGTTESGDENK